MIAIQVLLIAGFIVLLIKLLLSPSNLKTQAGNKALGTLFVLLAIFFITFPEKSNEVAHLVGVSRGADLLLYMLTLGFIFVSLSFYLRLKQKQNHIVKLARKIAILETNQSERSIRKK